MLFRSLYSASVSAASPEASVSELLHHKYKAAPLLFSQYYPSRYLQKTDCRRYLSKYNYYYQLIIPVSFSLSTSFFIEISLSFQPPVIRTFREYRPAMFQNILYGYSENAGWGHPRPRQVQQNLRQRRLAPCEHACGMAYPRHSLVSSFIVFFSRIISSFQKYPLQTDSHSSKIINQSEQRPGNTKNPGILSLINRKVPRYPCLIDFLSQYTNYP